MLSPHKNDFNNEIIPINLIIGDNIKLVLDENKKSQRWLSAQLKMTPNTVTNYVLGRRSIEAVTLFQISILMQKPIAWFFTDNSKSEVTELTNQLQPTMKEQIPVRWFQSKLLRFFHNGFRS